MDKLSFDRGRELLEPVREILVRSVQSAVRALADGELGPELLLGGERRVLTNAARSLVFQQLERARPAALDDCGAPLYWILNVQQTQYVDMPELTIMIHRVPRDSVRKMNSTDRCRRSLRQGESLPGVGSKPRVVLAFDFCDDALKLTSLAIQYHEDPYALDWTWDLLEGDWIEEPGFDLLPLQPPFSGDPGVRIRARSPKDSRAEGGA